MTTDTNNSVQAMLRGGQFITAPGVFDLVSAKIADRTEAQAIYMTGYGVVASYLGQPDAGLATYTDMVDRAEAIAHAIHKPLIADGDPGPVPRHGRRPRAHRPRHPQAADRRRRHRLWWPAQRRAHRARL